VVQEEEDPQKTNRLLRRLQLHPKILSQKSKTSKIRSVRLVLASVSNRRRLPQIAWSGC
jgi:hypothetical protein